MTEQPFQIGVKGLIRNQAGAILMVKFSRRGPKLAYWDLPGGRINPGETLLDSLKRGVSEEIGHTFGGTPRQPQD